ncbi:MAG: substrate-binding domain-containing protein [Ruminococcus sp.]
MEQKIRPVIGVAAAQVSDIEQREILEGIIEEAQKIGYDIAVISNIYNPIEHSDVLCDENRIYDLLLSPELDGIVLISEVFISSEIHDILLERLKERSNIPIVAIGSVQPDFHLPEWYFINTSDENDMEDITNHLIEKHGFSDIAILTGYDYLDVSHLRVKGYKNSLEKHGIAYDEKKVFYGDFWLNSGRDTAKKLVSGEIPFPEAMICTNDYMAYGLLDELLRNNINIPEKMAVVGYEYVRERMFHSPVLTTYKRNRRELGRESIRQIKRKLGGDEYSFSGPPKGKIIPGNTCSCGISVSELEKELEDIRIKKDYDFLNLVCQFELRLTECRNMADFISTCNEFKFMIRNARDIKICLSENWYSDNETPSDILISYSVINKEPSKHIRKNRFSAVFNDTGKPSAYYLSPIFVPGKMPGYCVTQYDHPDTLDPVYRNWLKNISGGLVTLSMKNNIRYLLECQNLSDVMDSFTGLYNEKGFSSALNSANMETAAGHYIIFLQIGIMCDSLDVYSQKKQAEVITAAADTVKKLFVNNEICGRLGKELFGIMISSDSENAALYEDLIKAVLLRNASYLDICGMDSFACCTVQYNNSKSYTDVLAEGKEKLNDIIHSMVSERQNPNYNTLIKVRNKIYKDPVAENSIESISDELGYSAGHFRVLYRNCFKVTYLQDVINARVIMSKYLLRCTKLSLSDIAQKCGYKDSKYFFRQFTEYTGITPGQYRSKIM